MTRAFLRDVSECVEQLKLVLLGDEFERAFDASERAALQDARAAMQARLLRELRPEAIGAVKGVKIGTV